MSQINAIVREYDCDESGEIDFEEFVPGSSFAQFFIFNFLLQKLQTFVQTFKNNRRFARPRVNAVFSFSIRLPRKPNHKLEGILITRPQK